MKRRLVAVLAAFATISLPVALIALPAGASPRPAVTSLSTHRAVYWGGVRMTVRGANFTHVRAVMFGSRRAWNVHVVSPTRITLVSPYHNYAHVDVRVVTGQGTSPRTRADRFAFVRPTMHSHIQGGLTGRQEQRASAWARAHHHHVRLARRSRYWTPAMGTTAARRALSWVGTPYSWAGGNGSGPTRGVCSHNGGDLDCHIVGFDCSGLSLYAWWPYRQMAHYAATQHATAGRFHPRLGQLVPGDLVFFSGYIPGGIGHVAIYTGGGMVVEAPQSGELVRRSSLADLVGSDGYVGSTRPMTRGRAPSVPRVRTMTAGVRTSGGRITITGSNLANATSVDVGGRYIYRFVSRSANRLVVNVPAHSARAVGVDVSNPWGTAHRTLHYYAAPRLTSLSVTHGPSNGGTLVTAHGNNMNAVSYVTLNGLLRIPFRRIGPNRLLLTMPAHSPGTVNVRLHSAWGPSRWLRYTYLATPTPTTTTPGTTTTPPTTSAATTTPAPAPSTSTSTSTSSTTTAPATSSSAATSSAATPSGAATP